MKENNIEDFLRQNKPRVKDDPTFMLKTARKMDALEGIKDEVDRGRRTGLLSVIVALAIGLAIGMAVSAFILLAPKQQILSSGSGLRPLADFVQTCKSLVYTLTAGCAIALGILLHKKGSGFYL